MPPSAFLNLKGGGKARAWHGCEGRSGAISFKHRLTDRLMKHASAARVQRFVMRSRGYFPPSRFSNANVFWTSFTLCFLSRVTLTARLCVESKGAMNAATMSAVIGIS